MYCSLDRLVARMIPSVGQSSLAVAAAAAYYNATQLQGGCAGDASGSMSPLSTLAAAAGSRGAGAAGQSPPVAAAGGQSLFGMGVPFQMPAASGVGFGVGGLVGGYGAAGGWSGGACGGGGSGAGAGAIPPINAISIDFRLRASGRMNQK